MFIDRIFPLVNQVEEERNKVHAWDAACSLATFDQFRTHDLSLYLNTSKSSPKELEKQSWMITLLCFYEDMIQKVLEYDLISIIVNLTRAELPSGVRCNAVLAISLLTYHD